MLGKLFTAHLLVVCLQLSARQAVEPSGAPPAKCVVEGTAVDFATAEPLRKTTIRLIPASFNAAGYMGITDASGHFHLEGISAGNYELSADHAGYLTSEFGARKPGGSGAILRLKTGDKLTDLTVKLARCSVITGKVSDENGQPISRALVSAVSQSWIRGQRQYDRSEGSWTNDAGEYRIIDLPPGHYYLCAEGSFESFVDRQGDGEKRILPAFYPNSMTLDGARLLEVQPGQNLPGIDFQLHAGPVFHITGKLAGSGSHPGHQALSLNAHPHDLGNGIMDLESDMNEDGTFDFSGAPAGSYDIELIYNEYHQIIAKSTVEIRKSDVKGLIVPVPNRLELKGAVHSLNANGDPLSGLMVFALDLGSPLMSHPYVEEVEPDGTFKIENVWPGTYVLSISGEGEYVKSIQYGGQEVLGAPVVLTGSAAQVEILVSTGAGRVGGSVHSSDSDANISGLQVALASESPRLDRAGLQLAKTDQDGHFSFTNVPPGKYYAFATAEVDPGLLENRDLIAQLQQDGLEIEVPENGDLQIDVPLLSPDDVQRAIAAIRL